MSNKPRQRELREFTGQPYALWLRARRQIGYDIADIIIEAPGEGLIGIIVVALLVHFLP